ncbi:bacterial surface protein [Paenibacillus lutimineralis]|uniref:bacterial surface protein n=1 Tax=Paenibacillus lutimineralis TaxID=2707005 RepID=UPI001D0571FE|nr:bacterial surface protein [Paenibacillus lutimineralis]
MKGNGRDRMNLGTPVESMVYTDTVGGKIKFKYYGSKLRVIDSMASNRSTDIVISIDGVEETFSQYAPSDTSQTLCYEKTNLPLGYHEVIITNRTKRMDFDAIDIDVDGTLVDIDTPIPSTEEPEKPTTPEQPSGNRAILVVTLTTGLEKEYDLSMEEVNDFIEWYEAKQVGSGRASYAIDKHDNNKGPFISRKDYILFDRILTFEVSEY